MKTYEPAYPGNQYFSHLCNTLMQKYKFIRHAID
jgi:hypothetical protein